MHFLFPLLIGWALMMPAPILAQRADTLQTTERIAVFHEAEAMAIGPSGDIYVSTERGTALLRIDAATGIVSERYGIPGEMDYVTSLAVSESLNMYLADRTQARIGRYSRGFRLMEEYHTEASSHPFSDLDAFVVDHQRRVFGISRRDGLMAYWADTQAPAIIGDMREGAGELLDPVDITLMGTASVLVADAGSGSVLSFDRWGSFSRVFIRGLSESLSRVSVHDEHIWVLDGALLIRFDDQGARIRSFELDSSGSYLDIVATSSGVLILTRGGLYSLRLPYDLAP